MVIISVILSIIIDSCCNDTRPYATAAINIYFEGVNDSESIHAWIIETPKNDPSEIIDSINYGEISSTNNYSIQLFLEKYEINGDYYIYADSITSENRITNVEINIETGRCGTEDISFSYLFNGSFMTEKDTQLIISR